LFLVRKIIEKLGYRIVLESIKWKWSLFRIDFNDFLHVSDKTKNFPQKI
jgi:hypothetical protein